MSVRDSAPQGAFHKARFEKAIQRADSLFAEGKLDDALMMAFRVALTLSSDEASYLEMESHDIFRSAGGYACAAFSFGFRNIPLLEKELEKKGIVKLEKQEGTPLPAGDYRTLLLNLFGTMLKIYEAMGDEKGIYQTHRSLLFLRVPFELVAALQKKSGNILADEEQLLRDLVYATNSSTKGWDSLLAIGRYLFKKEYKDPVSISIYEKMFNARRATPEMQEFLAELSLREDCPLSLDTKVKIHRSIYLQDRTRARSISRYAELARIARLSDPEAVEVLEKEFDNVPENLENALYLGALYTQMEKRSNRAALVYEILIREKKATDKTYLLLASIYLKQERYDAETIPVYEIAHEKSEEKEKFVVALANAYASAGRGVEDRKVYDIYLAAMRKAPENKAVMKVFLTSYLKTRVGDENTLEILDHGYRLFGDEVLDALAVPLAVRYAERGYMLPEEEKVLLTALNKEPSPEVALYLGKLYESEERFEEARLVFEKLVSEDRTNFAAALALSKNYLRSGRTDEEALAIYELGWNGAQTPGDKTLLARPLAPYYVSRNLWSGVVRDVLEHKFTVEENREETLYLARKYLETPAEELSRSAIGPLEKAYEYLNEDESLVPLIAKLYRIFDARTLKSFRISMRHYRKDPGDLENLRYLALLVMNEDRVDSEALQILNRYKELGGNSGMIEFHKGLIFESKEMFDLAKESYRKAREEGFFMENHDPDEKLGLIALRENDTTGAQELLEAAFERGARAVPTLEALSRIYIARVVKNEKALQVFTLLSKNNESVSPAVLIARASLMLQFSKDSPDIVGALKAVLEIIVNLDNYPSKQKTLISKLLETYGLDRKKIETSLAEIYRKEGREDDEAMVIYRNAFLASPQDGENLIFYARCLRHRGKADEAAVTVYTMVFKRFPEVVENALFLAQIFIDQARCDELSFQVFSLLQKKFPEEEKFALLVYQQAGRLNRWSELASLLEEYLRKSGNAPVVLGKDRVSLIHEYAYALWKSRRLREAFQQYSALVAYSGAGYRLVDELYLLYQDARMLLDLPLALQILQLIYTINQNYVGIDGVNVRAALQYTQAELARQTGQQENR